MKKNNMKKAMFKKTIGMVFVFVLIGAAIFLSSCKDKDANEIVFAVDSTWPPFEFISKDKEIVGLAIDMVNAIAQEEGFTAKFITTSWDGIFAGLFNGDYDAISSSVTITDERKEKMDFSMPYFNAGQILAMKKDLINGVTSLEELLAKKPHAKIGAQLGTQGAFLVEKYQNADLKTYSELGPAVEELANGTIDGIVADTPLIVDYLLKSDAYKGIFATVGEQMTEEQYGLVVKKGNVELLNRLNKGLQKIKQNGTLDILAEKWIK